MKILITGADGYVGGGLMQHLPSDGNTIIPIGYKHRDESSTIYSLDLTDFRETNLYIKHVQPDIIIHLAGNKDVVRCESDKTFSRKINYETSKNIVEQCSARRIRLIYISTDYVFNGVDGPFHELSLAIPATQYGKDKLATENLIIGLSDYAIIRTAGIFGLNNDFVETVIKKLKQKSVFHAYTNLKNNPTFIKDLSSMLQIIVGKKHIGTFHCAGSESIARYDFAVKVSKAFQLEQSFIVPTNLDLLNDVRPFDLSMDCIWTYRSLKYFPKDIETTLQWHKNVWVDKLL